METEKVKVKKEVQYLREKLRVLRFSLSAGKLKNVREIKEMKKEIARILTKEKHA